MKLIGKGSFTKAYLNDQGECILKSKDPVKECIALWGFPESYLLLDCFFFKSKLLETI